jgi:hypothetical protein
MLKIPDIVTPEDLKNQYTLKDALLVAEKLQIPFKKKDVWSHLCYHWDYDTFREITREIAQSDGGKYDPKKLDLYKQQYTKFRMMYTSEFGEVLDWVYHPSQFDEWRKKMTYGEITFEEYELGCKQHGMVATIADLKSKILEIISFHEDPEIYPILGNKKGLDYIYRRQGRDWKTSKSPGNAFIDYCKKKDLNPIEYALSHPEVVAKSLYENQDSTRFGFESRHFIVSLGSDLKPVEELIKSYKSISYENPMNITFTYKGKDYSTQALVSYI